MQLHTWLGVGAVAYSYGYLMKHDFGVGIVRRIKRHTWIYSEHVVETRGLEIVMCTSLNGKSLKYDKRQKSTNSNHGQ